MLRGRGFACLSLLWLGAASLPASAAPEIESYWGPFPAPTDSATLAFQSRPMPLWEASLVWPYRVVTFPLYLAYEGVHGTVLVVDPLIRTIAAALRGPGFPIGIEPGFGYGTGGGFGGGLTLTGTGILPPDRAAHLRAEASTRGERRVTFGYRYEGRGPFQIGAGHRVEPYSRFYGIGPRSREDDESFYTLELNWLGASRGRRLSDRVLVTGEVLYSSVGARTPGDDETPALSTVFPDLPPGFRHTSDGMSLGLTLTDESFPGDGRPEGGHLRKLEVIRYEGIGDGEPSFWQFRGEIGQILPVWFDRRALAFRGVASWIDPTGSVPVSFPLLQTNDEPDLFRGYQDFRFRDRGLLLGTLEYRWPFWAFMDGGASGIDAYLFSEVGQVFGDEDEIAIENVNLSYGFGLRFLGRSGFLARFEVARSEEGTQIRFAGVQLLQFTRGGLYHGRNPIPFR